jgi:hypothetical protein
LIYTFLGAAVALLAAALIAHGRDHGWWGKNGEEFQTLSTVALVGITAYYAWQTRLLTRDSEAQISASITANELAAQANDRMAAQIEKSTEANTLAAEANESLRDTYKAANMLEIGRDIQSESQRATRGRLFAVAGTKKSFDQWTAAEKDDADCAVQVLNTAAWMSSRDLLPALALDHNWGNVFRRVFAAAEERILERRGKEHDPILWKPFYDFAKGLVDRDGRPHFYAPPSREDRSLRSRVRWAVQALARPT